jgi:hypothetical protein
MKAGPDIGPDGASPERRAHGDVVLAGRAGAGDRPAESAPDRRNRRGGLSQTDHLISLAITSHLNHEVKDRRPPEVARPWRVLEFKVQIRFVAAMQ